MKRVDQRKVRAITEQTTRKALNEQQLNEAGFIKGLGTALWNGGKNFFRGAGPGFAGRAGRWLGFGAKGAARDFSQASKVADTYRKAALDASNKAGQWAASAKFVPGNAKYAAEAMTKSNILNNAYKNASAYERLMGQEAMTLARNSARAKGLGLGLIGGGLLGAGLAGGSSSSPSPAYSDPQMSSTPTVYPMPQSNNPYAGYGGGYGGMDPYTAYGGVDPYAAYYSGAYSDPYAAYYSGAYSDPYAAYYGGAYSNPYGGGGSSSNNMDLATMMALMNQGGDSSALPMLMAMNGGNIDDQTLQMMMMMNQGGGNDIWGLGGYHT